MLKQILDSLGWLMAGAAAVLTVLHAVLGDGMMFVVWVHAMTSWWPLAILPVMAFVGLRRRWDQLALACFTLLGWLWFNRPPLGADSPGSGEPFRVVSVNQLMVNPRIDALAAELIALKADVLVVQEFTPDLQALLSHVFPYRQEHPEWHSFGGAIYSRHPLQNAKVVDLVGISVFQAEVWIDGQAVQIWNVHTRPPFTGPNHRDWLVQTEAIAQMATWQEGPLVVAGDFNLTRHHQGYATLTAAMHDVHRRCGRWTAWTWPNPGLFPLAVPRIKLDYVFIRGPLQCAAVAESEGNGSDHRPIVVDLVLTKP